MLHWASKPTTRDVVGFIANGGGGEGVAVG